MNAKSFVKKCVGFLFAVMLASCGGSNVYEMVPTDAQFAVKVDAKSLLQKSLGDKEGNVKVVLNELKSACDDDFENEDLARIIKGIIDDPEASGVSFNVPFVVSGKGNIEDGEVDIYITIPLANAKKFKEFTEALYKESKDFSEEDYWAPEPKRFNLDNEKDGYYFGDFIGEDMCLGIDKKVAVIYVSSEGLGENLKKGKRVLNNLFAQEDGCVASGFKEFKEADNDVSVWVSCGNIIKELMKIYKYDLGIFYKELSAKSGIYTDAYYLMNVNFEMGKTIVEGTYGGSKELKNLISKYYTASSSKYFKYMPKNAVAAVNIGFDQDVFVDVWGELLKQGESMEDILDELKSEYGVNEKLLKGLPGVVTAALSLSPDENNPSFAVAVECNKEVFGVLDDVIEDFGFEKEGNAYVYEDWSDTQYYLAYVDGLILFMDGQTWKLSQGKALKDNYNAASTSSIISKGGFAIDLTALPKESLEDFSDEIGVESQDLLGFISSVNVIYDKASFKLECNMGDKKSYILQKFVDVVAEYIAE